MPGSEGGRCAVRVLGGVQKLARIVTSEIAGAADTSSMLAVMQTPQHLLQTPSLFESLLVFSV